MSQVISKINQIINNIYQYIIKLYKFIFCKHFHISYENYIKFQHSITTAGLAATLLFSLLTLSILIPINLKGEKTIAASGDTSTTSLTLSTTSGSAELDLLVTSDSGTFASSTTPLSFSASTNNYTGYTLSIKSATSSTNLTNSTKDANNNTVTTTFTSLSSTNATTKNGITATTFNSSAYNNQWGFKPSYYNSTANSDKFYPSPDSTGATINRTSCANNTSTSSDALCKAASNEYTIEIGARATYAQVAGTYTNKYILSAVGNFPKYSFKYLDSSNSNAEISSDSADPISSTSVTLASAPSKTGYTFAGWCTVDNSNNPSVCKNSSGTTGTTYAAGAAYSLDLTNVNTVNFYTIWTINTYNLVVTGDANLSSMTLKQGSTSGTTISGGKSGNTITFSNLTYGVSYYLYPVFNSGYEFSSWTKKDTATNAVLGSTSAVNTYYKMGNGAGTLTLASKSSCTSTISGYMQDALASSAYCEGASGTMTDRRDSKTYTVKKINGRLWMTQNLRITGTISSTDSNFSRVSSYNVSANDLSASSNSSSSGPCYGNGTSGGNGYVNACSKNSGSKSTGVWYNYAAATAGQITGTSNSTAATQDICPSGWRLPTGPNTTSGTDFNKLVGNASTVWQNPTAGLTAFGAVAGGDYSNGALYYTNNGVWWSATASSSYSRHLLYYNSNNGQFLGGSYDDRYRGFFIRCVRSS